MKTKIPAPPWTYEELEKVEAGLYDKLARENGCGSFGAGFRPSLDLTAAYAEQEAANPKPDKKPKE